MAFKERDPRKHIVVYDLESYPNLFFVGCRKYSRPAPDKPYVEGETNIFFIDDYKDFKTYMTVNKNALWVAFNNKNYDDPMLMRYVSRERFAVKPTTDETMRSLNDLLINGITTAGVDSFVAPKSIFYFTEGKVRVSKKVRKDLWLPKNADLFDFTGKGSLKMKAIILNAKNIMESPVHFSKPITTIEEKDSVIKYMLKDLDQTFLLYEAVENEFKTRDMFYDQFGGDAYGVNSPNLAEMYILDNGKYYESLKKNRYGKTYPTSSYMRVKNVKFKNPNLKKWYEEDFIKSEIFYPNQHTAEKPSGNFSKELDMGFEQGQFTIGLGGYHSVNKNCYFICKDDEIIVEPDVTSLYPSSQVIFNIHPPQAPDYNKVMKHLLQERVLLKKQAKETGDPIYKTKEQALKLVLNSGYGKLNDKYSRLFDPVALHTVTLNNQICLLWLIDMIWDSGLDVVFIQGNTDAICYKIKKKDLGKFKNIIQEWETKTGFSMGYTFFSKWFQQSVNNYFAQEVYFDG